MPQETHTPATPQKHAYDTEKLGELVVRFNEGDHAAFDLLYQELHGMTLRKIKKVVDRSKEKAEDINQGLWLRLLKNKIAIDKPGAILGWLSRAAINSAIDLTDWEKRRPQCSIDAEEMKYCAHQTGMRVDDLALLHHFCHHVEKILTAKDERRTWWAIEIEGYTHKEVAKELGRPESTIKTIYYNAWKKIRIRVLKETEPA